MKNTALAVTVAVALGTAFTSTMSTAATIESLRGEIASATGGGGHVNVSVDGTSATLSGYVDSSLTANAVRRAVLKHDDIDRVYDLISRD